VLTGLVMASWVRDAMKSERVDGLLPLAIAMWLEKIEDI
jgi:hypothetical protein